MTLYCGYEAAGHACSGSSTPGARALMSWFLGAYKANGARNLGIYNCRPIAGTAIPSVHGEGRAGDLGISASATSRGLANALVNHSGELQIQCVIHDHKIWSGSHCHEGWLPYRGTNPHTDHLHVELSHDGATHLTSAHINAVLHPAVPVYVRATAYGQEPAWSSTLFGIAVHQRTTIAALLRLNPSISDPDLIHVGQKIRVK